MAEDPLLSTNRDKSINKSSLKWSWSIPCTVCLFFMNLFGSRQVLETILMKFSILRPSRGKTEREAPEFHSRGNERPTERGNVPSVNRSTLQSSSLLFSPIFYKQHILLPRVGWRCTDKLFELNLKSLFPKCYTAHPLQRRKTSSPQLHHQVSFKCYGVSSLWKC